VAGISRLREGIRDNRPQTAGDTRPPARPYLSTPGSTQIRYAKRLQPPRKPLRGCRASAVVASCGPIRTRSRVSTTGGVAADASRFREVAGHSCRERVAERQVEVSGWIGRQGELAEREEQRCSVMPEKPVGVSRCALVLEAAGVAGSGDGSAIDRGSWRTGLAKGKGRKRRAGRNFSRRPGCSGPAPSANR